MRVLILTLETTCDETAAAIVDDQLRVLGSAVATQEAVHQRFGGVVPELASRAHVERILPVIDQALRMAGVSLSRVDAIAVANTPGLAGSLLVGLSAAKALCVALGKPLVAINHLHAHIYACRMAAGENIFPCLGMIVSGGHSSFYRCENALDFTLLGGTIDDAAGEAFDKVASLLGLPYPGGPHVERAARGGNARAFRFPRSFLNEPRLAFSFSGLKTAVRYQMAQLVDAAAATNAHGSPPAIVEQADRLSREPAARTARKLSQAAHQSRLPDARLLTAAQVADLAASFQAAVIDVLVGKAQQALQQTGMTTLAVGGGVAANAAFREALTALEPASGVRVVIAPAALCTDNAVMGAIAVERLRAGLIESLDLDVFPGLVRG